MRRFVLVLSVIAVVAVLFVGAAPAMAQDDPQQKGKLKEETLPKTGGGQLPKSGGPPLGPSAAILPSVALLAGGGLLVYALVRRR